MQALASSITAPVSIQQATADHSCKIFAAKLHPHRVGSNGYIWLYNWVKESPPIIASQIISDVVVLGLNPVQWNLIYFPSKKKKKKKKSKKENSTVSFLSEKQR